MSYSQTFNTGVLNGEAVFYKDGKVTSQGSYLKGHKHGIWKTYAEGNMLTEMTFVKGQLEGVGRYYEKNKVTSEGNYKQNRQEGVWKYYKTNGKLKYEHDYGNVEGDATLNEQLTESVQTDADKTFTIVETMPEFPEGQASLFTFISRNLKYPVMSKENGIQGTVYINFIVNRDGEIVEPKVIRGVHTELNYEALKIIKNMPLWQPGLNEGCPVKVSYTIPIKFKLT